MIEGLFSDYAAPYMCLQHIIEREVFHSFWRCCFFWGMHDLSMKMVEKECGPEAVESVHNSLDMAFPGVREECPGYGSMTCAQWFLIPLFFLAVGVLVVGAFVLWTVVVTVKYIRLRRRATFDGRMYSLESDRKPLAEVGSSAPPSPLCLDTECEPLASGFRPLNLNMGLSFSPNKK